MAEISLCATMTRPEESYAVHADRVISCGRALPNVEIAIERDDGTRARAPQVEGEILLRTPSIMDGYLNRPELTAQVLVDGEYRTGDTGFLDAAGRLYVTGRKKNLIIRGGTKFAGAELEGVAALDRDVALCAVVGVQAENEALPAIYLVLEVERDLRADGAAIAATAKRIVESARKRIGWMPEVIVFAARGRIPTTLNGKIQHAVLRSQLQTNTFEADTRIRAADLVTAEH
jgi:acyl-CoA synthetase (AMP-forming)/AMP-acid ligase II